MVKTVTLYLHTFFIYTRK